MRSNTRNSIMFISITFLSFNRITVELSQKRHLLLTSIEQERERRDMHASMCLSSCFIQCSSHGQEPRGIMFLRPNEKCTLYLFDVIRPPTHSSLPVTLIHISRAICGAASPSLLSSYLVWYIVCTLWLAPFCTRIPPRPLPNDVWHTSKAPYLPPAQVNNSTDRNVRDSDKDDAEEAEAEVGEVCLDDTCRLSTP